MVRRIYEWPPIVTEKLSVLALTAADVAAVAEPAAPAERATGFDLDHVTIQTAPIHLLFLTGDKRPDVYDRAYREALAGPPGRVGRSHHRGPFQLESI